MHGPGFWGVPPRRRNGKVTVLAMAVLGAIATSRAAADELAYIPLQGDKAVTVRDSRTLAAVAKIPTDGTSIDSRLTPDRTKLYVINTFSPKVSIIRAQCPAQRADWSDGERATGKCVPNTHLGTFEAHAGMSGYFSISRDGRRIYITSMAANPAAAPGGDPFTSMVSHVDVVDTRTDSVVRRLSPPRAAIAAEIGPDGRTLWIATADGHIQGLDPETGAARSKAIFVGRVPATVKISSDGRWLYAGNMPPPGEATGKPAIASVGVVDLKALKLVRTIMLTPGSAVTGIEITNKRHQVWTANGNHSLTVIDTRSNTVLKTIIPPFETAEAVDISTDGARALVIGFDGKLDPMKPGASFPAFAQLYSTWTFKPLGKPIFIGNNSGGIPSLSSD